MTPSNGFQQHCWTFDKTFCTPRAMYFSTCFIGKTLKLSISSMYQKCNHKLGTAKYINYEISQFFHKNFVKSAIESKKGISPSGNWTPVSRVTGGDTYHYTNEDETLKPAHSKVMPFFSWIKCLWNRKVLEIVFYCLVYCYFDWISYRCFYSKVQTQFVLPYAKNRGKSPKSNKWTFYKSGFCHCYEIHSVLYGL